MPTDWDHFRKIAEEPDVDFLDLPAWVRGYSSEMVRHASRPDGRLARDARLIGVLLRVKDDEREMLETAVRKLLEIGFLVEREGCLWIRNFKLSQQSKAAKKQAKYREKQVEDPLPRVTESDRALPPVTSRDQALPNVSVREEEKEKKEETRAEPRASNATSPGVTPSRSGIRKPRAKDPMAYLDGHGDPEVDWAFVRWVQVFDLAPDTERTPQRITALKTRLDDTRNAGRDWRADVESVLRAGMEDPWVRDQCGGEILRMFEKREQFERYRRGPPQPKPQPQASPPEIDLL